MNFQSFNLDLKETNDFVLFNASEREFHILGPMKEKVSIPVFTLSTLGTDMIFFSSTAWPFSHSVTIEFNLVVNQCHRLSNTPFLIWQRNCPI